MQSCICYDSARASSYGQNRKKDTKNGMAYTVLSILLVFCLLLSGCGGGGAISPGGTGEEEDDRPLRDTTPQVLVPDAPGTDLLGNETVSLDVSNKSDGYFVVQYGGSNDGVKLILEYSGADGKVEYQYDLTPGQAEVFNFPAGSQSYSVGIYENVGGTQYTPAYEGKVDVQLGDEFKPYLYPNQFVWFTPSSTAVAKASEVAAGAKDDIGVIENIYEYVADNIKYDLNKAENVQPGYLPDVDRTLAEGKGICFDYASLMTAMLRSQGIPTKLVTGYASTGDGNTVYHAWISVYTEEHGWIENIIEFHGEEWVRMDPTFASTSGSASTFVGDGSGYQEMYFY